MTVIVEVDAASAEALQSAVGRRDTVVPGLEQLRRHLDVHPGEYAVVLGPSVDQSAGVALADTLRVTKPALGVILVRRRVDTAVLADALRAGMREVVEERDLTGLNEAVSRAYTLHVALTSSEAEDRRKGPATRHPDHGLLGQGRRRQDNGIDQPGCCPGRWRQAQRLHRRPRPGPRRRLDRDAAVPGPYHRRRRRHRGLARPAGCRGSADRPLARSQRVGRAGAARSQGPDQGRDGRSRSCASSRSDSTSSSSTPRRRSTTSCCRRSTSRTCCSSSRTSTCRPEEPQDHRGDAGTAQPPAATAGASCSTGPT